MLSVIKMDERIENFYNKFNEEKRLLSRKGQIEYITTMKYIHQYINCFDSPKILEVGAGTGRYCVALANEGYDVTAVELAKTNLGRLKAKKSSVKAYQGNAMDLSLFEDESFEITLLLGPMYHLSYKEERIKALKEAKRVTKKGGYILIAYIMNEYAIWQYGFIDGHILETKENYDESFHILDNDDLYTQVRIEDIDELNKIAGLQRVKIIAADGLSELLRTTINKMSEEVYQAFIEYHLATCERADLIGASCHSVDIVRRNENV